MPLGSEISLLPFFSLSHVKNTGIAFGLFQGKNFLFTIVGLFVMAALIVFAYRTLKEDRFVALVMAGVLGGALGNLTDRIFFHEVTDFLDFYWGAYHWPSFNVADSAICVGMVLMIWHSLFKRNVPHPH